VTPRAQIVAARHAHATTTRSALTRWEYTHSNRHGVLLSARAVLASARRQTIADVLIAPPQPCPADARSALAMVFDRLPGLTVAAVPIDTAGLLLGDHAGTITVVPAVPVEVAAVSAYLWLITGRPLRTLVSISRIECLQRRLRLLERGTPDLTQQLDGLREVAPSHADLIVTVGDLGQRHQHFGLIHR
jgi:hypothetical protein